MQEIDQHTDAEFEIKPLSQILWDELFEAHTQAFKDYPFQWTKEALKKTIYRRGYDASISFGAFHNSELVSFTLNGIGNYNGMRTAYDTGTGTVAQYRGKGLASKIFAYSVPFMKAINVRQYILEVLEDNKKAFSVYQKQGFVVSRKFDCFRIRSNEWDFNFQQATGVTIKEIDFSFQKQMEAMIDFNLSWQNNFQALLKAPDDFKIIGAFRGSSLIGFGIVEPKSGDIPQLAVSKSERRKGIGTTLMSELRNINEADIVKIVNIDSGENGIIDFMGKCGIPKIVSQFEMIKRL